MSRDIVIYPHPTLLSPAGMVEKVDTEVRIMLNEMTNLMRINNGIGLAAPQLGISKRLIVVELNHKLYQIINPEIGWQSGSQLDIEGCLSLPGQLFSVGRAKEVVIQGISPEEKDITILANGLLARVFQHEIDHLDGILINASGMFVPANTEVRQTAEHE